jgi:hypothetical protein
MVDLYSSGVKAVEAEPKLHAMVSRFIDALREDDAKRDGTTD